MHKVLNPYSSYARPCVYSGLNFEYDLRFFINIFHLQLNYGYRIPLSSRKYLQGPMGGGKRSKYKEEEMHIITNPFEPPVLWTSGADFHEVGYSL